MDTIRWGILSTARIAGQFARDLAHVEGAELVAVGSRTAASAEAFAREHGVPRTHGSYRALYDDPDVDAIYVATPHTLHAPNAADALRAGKAVLCEKPLTTTPAEARALVAVAEETGSYLLEGMWTHFLPAVRQAKAWVEAGRIGRVLHVKADFGYPIPYAPDAREYAVDLAGGALLDVGIYPVAFAWLVFGRDPERVEVVARRAPNGVEDDLVAVFDYGDATATLGCSFRTRLRNEAVIVGETGYIALPDFFRARTCSLYRLDERVDRYEDDRRGGGYEFEAAAVGDDLRAGRRESPVVPLAASVGFQEHMARVRERM